MSKTDVIRHNQILQDIRRSLHHETTKEKWGLFLTVGFKLKASSVTENLKNILFKIKISEFNEIKFTPEKTDLKGIICHHIIFQRVFLSWINKSIDKYLDPEDRIGDYAIDAIDNFNSR